MTIDTITTYGEGGYNPSAQDGNITATEQVAIPPTEVNRRTLTDRASAALAANVAFLNIATPTAAQNAAQVKALTRQVNALIRLTLNELDTDT